MLNGGASNKLVIYKLLFGFVASSLPASVWWECRGGRRARLIIDTKEMSRKSPNNKVTVGHSFFQDVVKAGKSIGSVVSVAAAAAAGGGGQLVC